MNRNDMREIINGLLDDLDKEGFQADYCRRIETESGADIFLGLDINKTPYFRFISDDENSVHEIRPRNGFRIKQEDLSVKESPSGKTYRITKGKSVDKDMFLCFISDLAETVATKDSVISDLVSRLIQWAEFFKNCPEGVLSITKQIGLYGELDLALYFVKKGFPEIVEYWNGPDKAAKDYVFRDSAIEVKTSLLEDKNRIQISNEFQLDSEGFNKLFLYFLIVSEDNTEGQTLSELIEAIRYYLANDTLRLSIFEEQLKKAGYEEAFRDRYTARFFTNSSFCYEVTQGFPCITPASLIHGISSVSYRIDIATCSDFLIPFSKLDQFVIAGGENEH